MKKFLIILIFVLVVVALGIGGYYLRGRQESATPPARTTDALPSAQTAGNQNTTTQLPQTQQDTTTQNQQVGAIAGSALNIISQSQALDYFADKGSNVFILQPDGQVIMMSGGNAESLSNSPLANITSASFSADGKRIAAYTSDSLSGNKIHIFDVEKKIWSLFPNVAQSFSWSPDSHKIAYISSLGGIKTIYTADVDNSRAKPSEIIKIRGEDISLSWPIPSTIFIGDKPSGSWNSSVWSLNISKKTLSPLLTDLPGLETVWSSSTTQIMGLAFSSNANGNGGKLQLINQDGKKLQTFDFITFPSKCAFYDKQVPPDSMRPSATATSSLKSSTSTISKTAVPVAPKPVLTLVCAIPRDGDALNNSPLPDAYLKKALFTSDDFFEINVSTGEFKSVFSDSSKNLDAGNVKIFNQSVFFVNRYDKKVYSIVLPK